MYLGPPLTNHAGMTHRYRPHSNGRNGVGGLSITVLLVEPDDVLAEAMQQHLPQRLPNVAVTRCSTLASARAYLSGNPFDAVLMAHELPDGSGLDLLDLRATLGLESYFFVRTNGDSTIADVSKAAMKAGATACFVLTPGAVPECESLDAVASEMSRLMGMADDPNTEVEGAEASQLSAEAAIAMLEELRAEAGAVAHAINNPLTVITGNAQFLMEVARTEQSDSPIVGPIEDINAATQQLSEALARLSALRERIAGALGTDDRIDEG